MKKLFFLCLLFLLTTSVKSQTKNQHIAGLNVGFATLPSIVRPTIDLGVNYFYARRHFCSKIDVGVMPSSNFGPMPKTFVHLGFTTKINNPFSFHWLLGLGGMSGTKSYTKNNFKYDATIGGASTNIGLLMQPLKDNKLFLGLSIMLTKYDVYPLGWMDVKTFEANSYKGSVYFINLSINYKLNAKNNVDNNLPLK